MPSENDSGKCAARVCPTCGAEFTCEIVAGRPRCWCFDLPSTGKEPLTDQGCLCPDCLRERLAAAEL